MKEALRLTPEQWNKHKESFIWFHENKCEIPLLYATKIGNNIDYTYTNTLSWDSNLDYIINDEYVEFRKAIYEGKTIIANESYELNEWTNPNLSEILMYDLNILSVKEENKFKVGDWIRSDTGLAHQVKKITHYYHMTDGTEYSLDFINKNFTKWEPKKNEWCWFYDNNKEEPKLRKFNYKTSDDMYVATSGNGASLYIEPFIGKPSTMHLEKEKKWDERK